MNEHPESDDLMPLPGWRYILWNGWNLLAIGWLFIGALVGLVTNLVCSPLLRDGRMNGAVAIAFGVALVVADLIWRWRDARDNGWRRYVSPIAGGAVLLIPSWLIGSWVVAAGIATLLVKA